jgi:uncharacterized Zn finger protein (UPF0148 family)
VRSGEQVLVCPECQRQPGWQSGLDRCPECDGVRLSKALGVVRCSACGWAGEVAEPAPERGGQERAGDERLATEVAAALERVLRTPEADQ